MMTMNAASFEVMEAVSMLINGESMMELLEHQAVVVKSVGNVHWLRMERYAEYKRGYEIVKKNRESEDIEFF